MFANNIILESFTPHDTSYNSGFFHAWIFEYMFRTSRPVRRLQINFEKARHFTNTNKIRRTKKTKSCTDAKDAELPNLGADQSPHTSEVHPDTGYRANRNGSMIPKVKPVAVVPVNSKQKHEVIAATSEAKSDKDVEMYAAFNPSNGITHTNTIFDIQ